MASHRILAGLKGLLEGEQVRRAERAGGVGYAAVDVVAALADTRDPAQYWADLKLREPALAALVEAVEFAGPDGQPAAVEAVRLDGVLRLVQSIPSARAERIKQWLAQTARERLEESENPELAVLRTRKLYEHKGYSPRWVDKRLRGVSARQELTGEWFKRGATDSEQYRALTNEMIHAAFGMDVEGYRRYKNLFKTGENLRDHMTDLELALTALAETVAVNLHRDRGSQGFEQLAADAKDAGEIAAGTRREIESRGGKPVLTPGNHRAWWMGRRTRRGTGGVTDKAVA
jgi:DNA-damage-inducible protein D